MGLNFQAVDVNFVPALPDQMSENISVHGNAIFISIELLGIVSRPTKVGKKQNDYMYDVMNL